MSTWRKAFPVPGLAALLHGQPISFEVISCRSPGNCTVAGSYSNPAVSAWTFVVTERHGIWGNAQPVRSRLGGGLAITALSCTSAGNCVAAGYSYPQAGGYGAFAVTETHGTWHTAQTITGPGTGGTEFDTLTCAAAGSCVFAGAIVVRSVSQAASAAQAGGRWGPARVLPGILALDHGKASSIEAVSCPARSLCTAVGSLGTLVAGHPFVTAQR